MGNTAERLDFTIPKSLTLRIASSNFGAYAGASFEEIDQVSFGATAEAALASLLVKCGFPIVGSPKDAASNLFSSKRLGDSSVSIVFDNVTDLR